MIKRFAICEGFKTVWGYIIKSQRVHIIISIQWFSECGPQTSSISVTWNLHSWVSSQTCYIRNSAGGAPQVCVLTTHYPGGPVAHLSVWDPIFTTPPAPTLQMLSDIVLQVATMTSAPEVCSKEIRKSFCPWPSPVKLFMLRVSFWFKCRDSWKM